MLAFGAMLLVAACGNEAPRTQAKSSSANQPARYDIGRVASAVDLAPVDIDVHPAGAGLPSGRGTVAQGGAIYAAKCAVCHGRAGEGQGTFPKLIGAEPRDSFPFGNNVKLVKTIGNYWPYATTLYDYVHRAMPLTAPGSLQPDEVYALVAFLLARNEIVGNDAVMDARTLPAVKMPARAHFVGDDRKGGKQFR
jgi:cytochrome c